MRTGAFRVLTYGPTDDFVLLEVSGRASGTEKD
jgi:hypothetical protein